MTDDAGALSSQGRFQRMEEILNRIETKLDTKADVVRLQALEDHVRELEAGRIVSPLSQMYLGKFADMEKAVELLEEREAARAAVAKARDESNNSRTRWIAAAASVAMIINVVMGAVVVIGRIV